MTQDPMKSMLAEAGITDDALTVCARHAYDLLQAGRPNEAEVIAQGLVVADKANSYFRTLLATALYRKDDLKKALAVVDEGLTYEPENPQLAALRGTVVQALRPAAAR